MKTKCFFNFIVAIFLGMSSVLWAQITAAGDIAFTAINANGDSDFAFLALVDISANTTVYISDKTWDGVSAFPGTSEGILAWASGGSIIKAGTIIYFTDVDLDSNANFGASVGTLTDAEGGFNISASGDTLLAYLGSDQDTPTTFLAGIKNAVITVGELDNTGLTAGTHFLEFNPTASPNGGFYSGSRSSQSTYSNYLTLINNKTNWTHNTSNGEATLPISTTGFSISTTTWTGTSGTDWTVSGNWNNGVPDNSFAVVIPNVTNKPIISSGTSFIIGNLTLDASSSLTLNAGKGLTISGNLSNSGTITIASDASTSGSLIVTGTSSGNITYNRYLESATSTKWHLIAAPVGAFSINTFATTGANNVATSGVEYSVTPYDNTGTLGSTTWNHWTTNGTGAGNISTAGNFVAGKGYEILTTADGTVAFTGTVPVAQVSIAVTVSGANAWNLIGNPFPSSIPANTNADATNNFITVNTADMDASFQALYLWDPGTSSYDLINQSSASTFIAPGQAFFVKSVSGGSTVDFTTAMRSNQSAVAFQRMATTTPSITLSVDNNNTGKTKNTTIKYIGGTSLGLDPGFDAGRFGGSNSSFDIYTQLVNDNGVDFALQVVPDTDYDTTIIPIGLEADAGTQITFKAQATDLPVGKKVFLEDRLLGSFTEINNSDKTYTLILSTQEQGVARFFLRTLDNLSTLATTTIDKLRFTVIAQPKSNTIRIIGNVEGTATLDIYDTLGRFIYTTKLKATTDNEVSIPSMAKGIYFVKVKTGNSHLSTKIAWY